MVSLKEQLNVMFPDRPNLVKQLLNEYWEVTQVAEGWSIGRFIQLVKGHDCKCDTCAG